MLRSLIPQKFRKHIRRWLDQRRYDRSSGPRIRSFADRRSKIVYALTPPSGLRNIGDHAQAVAIHAWLRKHFPDRPVLEVDKNEALFCIGHLQSAVGPEELIFLHSGGNLGDRGIWSETGRRNLIEAFPNNPIISLPQTIFFSDTPEGHRQRAISQQIYARHPRLTIIGRDLESGRIAAELFPKATTFAMPDFVLSLDRKPARRSAPAEDVSSRKVLLCLRRDNESALSDADKQRLPTLLSMATETFDTTLDRPIEIEQREKILNETLDYFGSFDAVVTDRYHGLIFAVLCHVPTVVLRTVDHKLISAVDWFSDIRAVKFAESLEDVPRLLEEVLSRPFERVPDWNALYFDPLACKSGSKVGE